MTHTMTMPEKDRLTTLSARSLKDLRGYRVEARDGELGKIDDFYFDDVTWTLRYFVVETGGWFDKRKVLLSPKAFTDSDGASAKIRTTLTREQVEKAPHADLAKPVSRQYEIALHTYFGWPMYWIDAPGLLRKEEGDSHLRSVREVLGYGIRASDGDIGHVEDMLAEERSWIVRYLAIDTRNWLPGRKVVISPVWIESVSWADGAVAVDMTREAIKKSPAYEPGQAVNRTYETKLYDHYGRPKYWV